MSSTSTYLHVKWESNTLVTITSAELQVFNTDMPQAASLTIPLDSVVTALHLDEHVMVTGDQEGLVAVWAPQTARKLHYINVTNTPGSPQMERHSEDDSIAAAFAFRINCIRVEYNEAPPHPNPAGVRALSAQVIASHEDSRVTVWNLQLSTQEQPLQTFHVRAAVRELLLCEEGEVQALLPPPLPPTLLSWHYKGRPSTNPSPGLPGPMSAPAQPAPALPRTAETLRMPASTLSEEHVRVLTSASFHGRPSPAPAKEFVASASFHVSATPTPASTPTPAQPATSSPSQPSRALSNPNFARGGAPEALPVHDSSRVFPYERLRSRDLPADVDRLNLEVRMCLCETSRA